MENRKVAIADAYGEMLDAEIDAILASAPKEQHIFSDGFEKKMNALINNAGSDEDGCKTEESVPVKRRKVRKLWLIAAAILALAAAACAVPEVRKSIAGFFIKVFGDHVEYSQPEITKTTIEEKYELSPIPYGFEKTEEKETAENYRVSYADADENMIILYQYAGGIGPQVVDNKGEFSDREIGEKKVSIYNADDYSEAAWIADGYYFVLTCVYHIELQEFESLIAAVKTE